MYTSTSIHGRPPSTRAQLHARTHRCKNEGGFTFGSKQIIQSGLDGPWTVQAEDVDGDGDRDVVHMTTGARTLSWHENTDGAGTFGEETILANAVISPSEFSVADFNGECVVVTASTCHANVCVNV